VGEGSFLRLLAADASVAEVERLAARIRRAAPEADHATLDGQLADALAVREMLERRARRERELGALYETAGDLSSLRDLDRVLVAIVRRARQLLGTDAAYLTLLDDARGDTYMRVTEGIRTDAFKAVRLSMGSGLGGLVAQKVRPYSTPDYFTDDQFDHSSEVDRAVSAEGLVAILGVPLTVGRVVIGVLFAANRRERPFAAEEVALLSSLAAHAAIAFENACLFQEVQAANEELLTANAVIRAHSDLVEQTATLHERLSKLVLEGGGMADVASAVSEVLGGGMLVIDAGDRVVAIAGPADDSLGRSASRDGVLPAAGPEATALRHALDTARSTGRSSPVDARRTGARRWVTPVPAGAEHLGALVSTHPGDASDTDLRALERAAQVTALLLLNERSMAEAEQRVRGDLLDDLLAVPQRDVDGLRRRAGLLGADLDQNHVVVVASSTTGERRSLEIEAVRVARELGGLASARGGTVVLLLPGTVAPAVTAAVASRLGRVTPEPVTCGGAGPAAGPGRLNEAHREAVCCLGVLAALDRNGQWATADELGVYGLLFGDAGYEKLDQFLEATIGPVAAYDVDHGTDLVRTLETFLDANSNLTRTAALLPVHVNTLRQRLDRLDRLVGDGWREGEARLQLHLALRLRRIRDGSGT
jgi:GAF domain-containing protein